jgi:hypothetical protein
MRTLLYLLPPELLIFAIVLIGFGVMLRYIRPSAALVLILGLGLMAAAAPLLDALCDMLPWWVQLLLLVWTLCSLLRWAAGLFLGEEAATHMTGALAADVVRGLFRLLFLPFRILGWLLFRRT